MPIYDAYLLVTETASPKFSHLPKVIELMLSLSCSSAKCSSFFKHEINENKTKVKLKSGKFATSDKYYD